MDIASILGLVICFILMIFGIVYGKEFSLSFVSWMHRPHLLPLAVLSCVFLQVIRFKVL